MPKKRTYPKSAEAFNAFIRKHGLEDLSKLEERLEVGKGYLRYYVSKGTARLREISMFRLSALAGISGIDPDLAAGYKADVDYYGKAAEEKALDPRIVWITNLRKSLGMSRRAMSLAMGRNPMYIANIEKTNKPKPQSLTCLSCCQLKLSFSFYGMTRQQINNKLTAFCCKPADKIAVCGEFHRRKPWQHCSLPFAWTRKSGRR